MKAYFDELELRSQYRPKNVPDRDLPARSFDIEAFVEDALSFYIACSNGHFLGGTRIINEWVDWLFREGLDHCNSYWNPDYDIPVLFKMLGEEAVKLIMKGQWYHVTQCGNDYSISYIPGRKFFIRYKRRWVTFWDACQFYGRSSLDRAAHIHLGMEKAKEHNPKHFYRQYVEMYPDEILYYCLRDARLCRMLSKRLIEGLVKRGIHLASYASPASITANTLLKKYIPILITSRNKKRKMLVPLGAMSYAYQSYQGNWVDLPRKGYFEHAYITDRVSAYPFQLRRIPDFTKGEYVFSKKMLYQAEYGWVKCHLCISPDQDPTPYGRNIGNSLAGVKQYGVGIFPEPRYLTLPEFYCANSLPGCYASFIDGWFFYCKNPFMPYKRFVDEFFEVKNELTEKLRHLEELKNQSSEYLKKWVESMIERNIVKTMLNSLYGKTIETVKKVVKDKVTGKERIVFETGNLFNPFAASYIVASHRLFMFGIVRNNRDKGLIGLATDAAAWEKKPDLSYSKAIGGMALEQDDVSLLQLKSGIYSYAPGHDWDNRLKVTSMRRGYHTKEGFSWYDLLKKYPNATHIPLEMEVMIKPNLALKSKHWTTDDIGRFVKVRKQESIVDDNNRLYIPEIKRASDLLEGQFIGLPVRY